MKIKSIQLKAAFLMIVFGLNTVVGFACAVGMNFKSGSHHGEEKKSQVHIHPDGSMHVHDKPETSKHAVHIHADGNKHIHQKEIEKSAGDVPPVIIANNNESKQSKENCCTGTVAKFDQTDKSLPQSVKINPSFSTLVSDYYFTDILYTSYINTSIRYFVRSYHPPIPNIRVAIQSFQI